MCDIEMVLPVGLTEDFSLVYMNYTNGMSRKSVWFDKHE